MNDNTRDLSKFGYRELKMAAELLTALTNDNNKTKFLGDGVAIEMNPNSGNVFLVDEDFNVAIMNGDNLEDFFNCPECGHEGFLDEMEHEGDKECRRYVKDIKKQVA